MENVDWSWLYIRGELYALKNRRPKTAVKNKKKGGIIL